MNVLNLYAGIGGNRKLWADCQVTAVEMDPDIAEVYKSQFPDDTIIIGDAHEYLLRYLDDFDFIWSSPPCQSHSRMIRSGRNRKLRYADMKLYEEILLLKHNFKGKWVVENVVPYYEPLIPSKKLGRHLFWSNFPISNVHVPEFKNMMNRQNLTAKKQMQDWLGIHYEKNIYYGDNHCPTQILRNCVHPDIGKHVFDCAIKSSEKPQMGLWQ
jgi:DNA (cytosine-5)-methyltransferase 1